MFRTSLALVALLVLAACTSNSGAQLPEAEFFVSPGQEFGLRVGETAGVVTQAAFVLVRFNGVLQDNRCPVDVTCVTAGSATVILSVQTALNVQDIAVDVPPDGTVDRVIEEVTVEVLGVRPDAMEGVTIDPLSYVVGLRVLETGSLPLP